jgi:hypothetical protein
MTAPGNREALSLSCLCCAMAGTFCSVVVCLVGGFMVRRVQDWQKSHQGLRAHLLPACMHGRTHAHAPVWAFVQQEDKYGWHLHACVMRRRSTGEDWRDRETERKWESMCMCMHCLCMDRDPSFVHMRVRLAQRNQPKRKKRTCPWKYMYPVTSKIATVGDGYQTVLHRD